MVLDAVLADPTFVWLGPSQDKLRHFTAEQGDRLRPDEYPHLTFGDGAAIGGYVMARRAGFRATGNWVCNRALTGRGTAPTLRVSDSVLPSTHREWIIHRDLASRSRPQGQVEATTPR